MEFGEGASYLVDPPDSAQAVPPLASTSFQLLPLAAISPRNFERLCLRLAEKAGDVEYAGLYGKPGQAQEGIDVLVRLAGGAHGVIQSRRIAQLTPGALAAAVSDFLGGKWAEGAAWFVYATSASADDTKVQTESGTQAERLRAKEIGFDVWDVDRLSRKLKEHPDLVQDFFGPEVLRAFLPDQAGRTLAQEVVQELGPRLEAALRNELRGGASAATEATPEFDGLLDLALLSDELAPEVREVLEDLKQTSRTEAAHLASYIRDDPRRARDLIRDPQPWVQRGSWRLHNALGLLASAAFLFADAERAFLDAHDRSPPDTRALMLMRARDAADNDDRPEDAAAHFERARALDSELIGVRVVEIKSLDSPEQQLRELDELSPGTDRERNNVDAARVLALLELDRPQDALAILDEILARAPDSIFALDRRAGIVYWQATAGQGGTALRDAAALQRAADDSMTLRDRVLRRGRELEAGRLAGRAADCFALAGNRDSARQVLASVSEGELAHDEVRVAVAQAWLRAGDISAARALLPEEASWTDDLRLIAAHVFSLDDDHAEHLRAVEIAAPLLDSDPHRSSAALAMVMAAAFDVQVPWPEEAVEALADASPAAAAHFRAERLTREGHPGEADHLLAHHASDPDILRSLVERALDDQNWTRALALAERLVSATSRADDRMLLAGALKGADRVERLNRELKFDCC